MIFIRLSRSFFNSSSELANSSAKVKRKKSAIIEKSSLEIFLLPTSPVSLKIGYEEIEE